MFIIFQRCVEIKFLTYCSKEISGKKSSSPSVVIRYHFLNNDAQLVPGLNSGEYEFHDPTVQRKYFIDSYGSSDHPSDNSVIEDGFISNATVEFFLIAK